MASRSKSRKITPLSLQDWNRNLTAPSPSTNKLIFLLAPTSSYDYSLPYNLGNINLFLFFFLFSLLNTSFLFNVQLFHYEFLLIITDNYHPLHIIQSIHQIFFSHFLNHFLVLNYNLFYHRLSCSNHNLDYHNPPNHPTIVSS